MGLIVDDRDCNIYGAEHKHFAVFTYKLLVTSVVNLYQPGLSASFLDEDRLWHEADVRCHIMTCM